MKLTGEINTCEMINGFGLRVSIFVSGCEHACSECFSKHTWDKSAGYEFTESIKKNLIVDCSENHIDGISILGGDPLASYNYAETVRFCEDFKNRLPHKTIYIWTGYDHEHVLEKMPEIVELANVIITGRFDPEFTKNKRELLYRGSSNQMYIINGVLFQDFPCDGDEELPSCLTCEYNDEEYSSGKWACHHSDSYGMITKSKYNKCRNWKGDGMWGR
ncbi:MAG: anaerobic ribonucleoside-triphosphate reductase activating protein [Paraclostridium sp.]